MSATTRDACFLLVLFLANVVQAITGFAGTVLAMPFSILLVGADDAKSVLAVMALLSCAVIAVQGRHCIDRRELCRIVAFMLVGMVAGVVVYELAPLNMLKRLYGVFVIAIALWNLVSKRRMDLSRGVLTAILLASGVIHGMFVSGGALLVVYAAQTLTDKERFRATMAAVWVVLNAVMLVQMAVCGGFTTRALALGAAGVVPLAAAVAIGTWVGRRVGQRAFMTLTYLLLLVSGVSIAL